VGDFRVLVTGSREWADHQFIRNVLDTCRGRAGGMIVVHGDNPRGADSIAAQWVVDTFRYATDGAWVAADPHPADWKRLGRAAGAARNQVMADKGADLCYAFFWRGADNAGTADCAARARAAGIPVTEYWGGQDNDGD
jgi:hypothetical protein